MIGSPHVHHRVTDSTNERAKRLAAAGAIHGTLVTADEQTAGRGRQGRQWVAPAGRALLMSLFLTVDQHTALVPLAAAVAVCHAFPEANGIKWPNDVWIDERKVAGVLVEARPDEGWAVIGIGLNVAIRPDEFPPELRETATSLLPTEAEGGLPPGGAPGVPRALSAINEALGHWVEASSDEVLDAYRPRDALSGRRVSWDGGEGVAEEVDERGHLVVEKDDGDRVALGAGEVHLAVER
jgi:BirA family transcriptional regulator, biotin operon repressor / biotin---[acetyl-CoA-carboxylase] ligase